MHLLCGWAIQSLFTSDLLGFIVVAIVVMSKELIWDKLLSKGTFDVNDFCATLAGSILYLMSTYLISLVV